MLKIPIFNRTISIACTGNLPNYCKSREYEGDFTGYKALVIPTLNRDDLDFSFEVVFEGKIEDKDIVHECFHLTCRIMDYIGSPLDHSSEECWAYLHEYLYEVIKNEVKAYM